MSSYDLKPGAPVDDRYSEFLNGIKMWSVYSQHAEESIIAAIMDRIGYSNRYCVEAGAADGLFMSNTRWFVDRGWNALYIEPDAGDFRRLQEQFAGNTQVALHQGMLSAEPMTEHEVTLDDVLDKYGAPANPDILSLDVDSCEYYLLLSMIRHKSSVLIVEYDPDAAPMFIPELRGKGQAGHLAMRYVAEARGYEVIGKTPTNLICVRRDLAPLLEKKAEAVAPAQASGEPTYTLMCQMCSRVFHSKRGMDNTCGACIGFTTKEKAPATRQQVFANGQWQDINAPEVFVHESEMEAANAGTLPVRVVQVETGPVKIALAMSTPRLGFLRPFENLLRVANRTGTSYFSGDGVFWHHALTRSINGALNWYDEKTGDDFDFILVADYDTFASESDLKELAQLLAHNPDYHALVPMQMKRGIVGQILGSFEAANMTHEVIPIRSGHFGFTLFRREFFERLPKPWFWEKPDEDGDWGAEEKGRIDADMGFWRGAMDAGLKVGLATKIIIGHGEEVVSYPKISGGQISNVYQPLNDWLGTQKKPEGIGVVL